MSIQTILAKSLKDGFLSKKFIPLFVLYSIFLLALLTFINPVLKILPDLLSLEFTKFSLGVVGVTFTTLAILFIILVFVHILFIGALIYQAYSNKSFRFSLKKSEQVYWKLIALFFILFFFAFITFRLSIAGSIIRIIIDLILFFATPILVIKNFSLFASMKKSFDLFSKNILKTVVFWLVLFVLIIIISFAFIIAISAIVAPALMNSISSITSLTATSTDKQVWTQHQEEIQSVIS